MRLAKSYDPQICSDLHEILFGVHSNLVEWDNPVAVNQQLPFANLSHPTLIYINYII